MSDPFAPDRSVPTDGTRFHSAWMKWAAAVGHARSFKFEIDAWRDEIKNGGASAAAMQYDAKRHGFPVVVTRYTPIPTRAGLYLGDAIHNFRSALDHIAWDMIARGTSPQTGLKPGQIKRIQFPIEETRPRFIQETKNRLPGIRSTDLTLIRREQPYVRGKRSILNIVSELDNRDKHHAIQPVASAVQGGRMQITARQHCVLTKLKFGKPRIREHELYEGAELCIILVRRTGPDPRINVQPHITVQESILGGAFKPEAVLISAAARILRLLQKLSDPPDDITGLGFDIGKPW